jgi:hypothetical protein
MQHLVLVGPHVLASSQCQMLHKLTTHFNIIVVEQKDDVDCDDIERATANYMHVSEKDRPRIIKML